MGPAMAAGSSDRFWKMTDIIGLIDDRETPTKRGAYRPGNSNGDTIQRLTGETIKPHRTRV